MWLIDVNAPEWMSNHRNKCYKLMNRTEKKMGSGSQGRKMVKSLSEGGVAGPEEITRLGPQKKPRRGLAR